MGDACQPSCTIHLGLKKKSKTATIWSSTLGCITIASQCWHDLFIVLGLNRLSLTLIYLHLLALPLHCRNPPPICGVFFSTFVIDFLIECSVDMACATGPVLHFSASWTASTVLSLRGRLGSVRGDFGRGMGGG